MATLHILSHHGDTKVEWDVRRAEAGDPEAAAAVREAERIFQEQLERGAAAFKVAPGEQATKMDTFDPKAERVVMIPRVAGG